MVILAWRIREDNSASGPTLGALFALELGFLGFAIEAFVGLVL